MLRIFLFAFIGFLSSQTSMSQTQGRVDKETKEFILTGTISDNYNIYGYALPDAGSKKIIVFTLSPDTASRIKYQLGNYSETAGLKPGDKIIYAGKKGNFAEMHFIAANKTITPFYMRKKYVETN